MKKTIFIFIFIVIFSIFQKINTVFASDDNQFVTVVNPVRISSYNKEPEKSLISEYQIVRSLNLPATWLITFDVLENQNLLSILKNMDKSQEIGIFLEVTDNFAKKTEVDYNNTGFWHHANSVFLSGYKQEERIKLIDKVFEKFKDNFGYYPSSVGSWWTDSFSLIYMKEKYGITANLGCSDQFSTDGYKIWGQPFSIPFYPSKYHAGIPASDIPSKLGVVTLLWAPRDPLNGYYNSLFSTQDYLVAGKNLDINYFKYLLNTYAYKNTNSFGQITVGLEADLDPDVYKKEYYNQLLYIKSLLVKEEITALNMKEFADWYFKNCSNLSEGHLIRSKDYLNSDISVTWFQNSKYRFSYEENISGEITIRDFRIYDKNFQEPYFFSPNANFNLNINTPFIIDKITNPINMWILEKGSEIIFSEEKIILKTKSSVPEFIKKNRYIKVNKNKDGIEITFNKFKYSIDGKIVKDYSIEAKHIFKSPKAFINTILDGNFSVFKKLEYFISQEEIIALEYLRTLPNGYVLVYDKECLQCSYSTKLKPLAFSNSRKYVQDISNKRIVKNIDIFENLERIDAKEKLKSLNIKYIYLSKFEEYQEKIPYSPGDLGIEKIFENANVEIWIVE